MCGRCCVYMDYLIVNTTDLVLSFTVLYVANLGCTGLDLEYPMTRMEVYSASGICDEVSVDEFSPESYAYCVSSITVGMLVWVVFAYLFFYVVVNNICREFNSILSVAQSGLYTVLGDSGGTGNIMSVVYLRYCCLCITDSFRIVHQSGE